MYQFHNERPTSNFLFDVVRGAIPNAFAVHKFGANFDIDQADDPERVYGQAADFILGQPWQRHRLFIVLVQAQAIRLY